MNGQTQNEIKLHPRFRSEMESGTKEHEKKIGDYRFNFRTIAVILSVIAGILAVPFFVNRLWVIGCIPLVTCLALVVRMKRNLRKKIAALGQPDFSRLLAENNTDWSVSQKLMAALSPMLSMPPFAHGIIEPEIFPGVTWRPFRIERYFGSKLNAELTGKIKGNMSMAGFLFAYWGKFNGEITGKIKGQTSPDLQDEYTLLFLSDESGKRTLRLLVPNAAAAAALIKQTHSALLDFRGSEYLVNLRWIGWSCDFLCGLSDINLTGIPNMVPVMDKLSFHCENTEMKNRPIVKVNGTMLAEGLALATALNVDGQDYNLLPTAYCQKLLATVEPILRGEEEGVRETNLLPVQSSS